MRTLIIIVLLIIQTDSDKIVSPDGNYEIIRVGHGLSDANTELTYHLVDNRTNDTTFITKSVIHDFLSPSFWWTTNSEILIFEQRNVLNNSKPSINVYDIQNDSLLFSTDGFVNVRRNQADLHFNKTKQLLLFFKRSRTDYKLVSLDLNKLNITTLLDFEHHDVYETPRITAHNKTTGSIEIEAKTGSHELVNFTTETK
ncbi:hypothetical protein [Fulvivirga sp.]|uniref:hypothetical protein n=1 Tax=Fulvivirga sp. TaxID=1931237 RepID=UPI0032F01821